jgi:hypothetical protein
MDHVDLLTDAFGRIRDGVHRVLTDLDDDALRWRPGADANPVGWLVWHLLRIQDDHLADVAGTDQVWRLQGFADRFRLPYGEAATGFGQSSEDVGRLRVHGPLLAEYADAVTEATLGYIATVRAEDLDRIVDDSWDPPVTLGVRLVSVVNDDMQHLGQAAYVKGMLRR